MDDSELQELSRKAAGCLPKDEWYAGQVLQNPLHGNSIGLWRPDISKSGWKWLHESTEACTEIMVRVLTGHNLAPSAQCVCIAWEVPVYGEKRLHILGYETKKIFVNIAECGGDLMLAFRIAVLRALIALSPMQAEAK